MSQRIRIAAGNWKMHTSVAEGSALAEALALAWKGDATRKMIVAPPFTHLQAILEAVRGSDISVAAQNCHWQAQGAFTGEVSPVVLKGMGVDYVIIGHSERREIFGETNTIVLDKINAALLHGLRVIFCCGEPLHVREAGDAQSFVQDQLNGSLLHLSAEQISEVIIAYEPIWAIGTGVTASADQAQEMHAFIRRSLSSTYGNGHAQSATILYGGSVKPSNATELFSKPDVDGGLVGGASLVAADFLMIAAAL
jgi:triosephosphate isomerase (TIM)